MEGIEKYYPGNDDWNEFVAFYSTRINDNSLFEKLILELKGHKDLAIVIFGIFRDERSLKWIKAHPSVLGGVSPIECLEKENLIKRLRTVLMRFPV